MRAVTICLGERSSENNEASPIRSHCATITDVASGKLIKDVKQLHIHVRPEGFVHATLFRVNPADPRNDIREYVEVWGVEVKQ